MSVSAQELIALIVQSCEIIDKAAETGDYKINNREMNQCIKLHNFIAEDLKLAEEIYGLLLEHSCISVKIACAFQCLKLDIYVDKSVNILDKLTKRTDIGIRRLDAEMCLRVWRGEFSNKTL